MIELKYHLCPGHFLILDGVFLEMHCVLEAEVSFVMYQYVWISLGVFGMFCDV